jgi:AraC family transcriptional regulator
MHRAPSSLPEPCSCHTPLYAGALVAIADWQCAGTDSHGEEWGEDDRVVITRRGVWELEVEGETRLADPATAVLWNAGAYRVRHPIGGGDQCTIFRLAPAAREALGDQGARNGRAFARRTRPIDGPTYLRHRRALERARQDRAGADPLAIEEPALALVSALREGDAGEDLPRGAERQVDRAREVIARDFAKPLTLAGIAAEAGCSPFHLSRRFTRATGTSIYRTVVRHRLREGLERLLDAPDQISRIALDLGFASHSHFTDAFRAEYGCTPSAARGIRRSLAPTRRASSG